MQQLARNSRKQHKSHWRCEALRSVTLLPAFSLAALSCPITFSSRWPRTTVRMQRTLLSFFSPVKKTAATCNEPVASDDAPASPAVDATSPAVGNKRRRATAEASPAKRQAIAATAPRTSATRRSTSRSSVARRIKVDDDDDDDATIFMPDVAGTTDCTHTACNVSIDPLW
jgi:hypothetical protein